MVETILTAPFVPNDVVIGEDTYRQLILTGEKALLAWKPSTSLVLMC